MIDHPNTVKARTITSEDTNERLQELYVEGLLNMLLKYGVATWGTTTLFDGFTQWVSG